MEEEFEFIREAELRLGTHFCNSNWVVANFGYDVLLGIPWHGSKSPDIDCVDMTLNENGDFIPVENLLEAQ